MGSSLGQSHPVHVSGFGSSAAIPADDDTNEFPRPTWGQREGECVSASGRVRKEHWPLLGTIAPDGGTGLSCFWCEAIFRHDGTLVALARPPVKVAPIAKPLPPEDDDEEIADIPPTSVEEMIAAEEGPGEKEAKRSKRKEAPVDEPTVECECGGVNPAAFFGHPIEKCLNCGQDLPREEEEVEPAQEIGRYERAHSPKGKANHRKAMKRKAIQHRVSRSRRDGKISVRHGKARE